MESNIMIRVMLLVIVSACMVVPGLSHMIMKHLGPKRVQFGHFGGHTIPSVGSLVPPLRNNLVMIRKVYNPRTGHWVKIAVPMMTHAHLKNQRRQILQGSRNAHFAQKVQIMSNLAKARSMRKNRNIQILRNVQARNWIRPQVIGGILGNRRQTGYRMPNVGRQQLSFRTYGSQSRQLPNQQQFAGNAGFLGQNPIQSVGNPHPESPRAQINRFPLAQRRVDFRNNIRDDNWEDDDDINDMFDSDTNGVRDFDDFMDNDNSFDDRFDLGFDSDMFQRDERGDRFDRRDDADHFKRDDRGDRDGDFNLNLGRDRFDLGFDSDMFERDERGDRFDRRDDADHFKRDDRGDRDGDFNLNVGRVGIAAFPRTQRMMPNVMAAGGLIQTLAEAKQEQNNGFKGMKHSLTGQILDAVDIKRTRNPVITSVNQLGGIGVLGTIQINNNNIGHSSADEDDEDDSAKGKHSDALDTIANNVIVGIGGESHSKYKDYDQNSLTHGSAASLHGSFEPRSTFSKGDINFQTSMFSAPGGSMDQTHSPINMIVDNVSTGALNSIDGLELLGRNMFTGGIAGENQRASIFQRHSPQESIPVFPINPHSTQQEFDDDDRSNILGEDAFAALGIDAHTLGAGVMGQGRSAWTLNHPPAIPTPENIKVSSKQIPVKDDLQWFGEGQGVLASEKPDGSMMDIQRLFGNPLPQMTKDIQDDSNGFFSRDQDILGRVDRVNEPIHANINVETTENTNNNAIDNSFLNTLSALDKLDFGLDSFDDDLRMF